VSKEFGIKPYIIDKEKTHIENMRTPTWANQASVIEEKHSELVKPYEWGDYPEMEHFYPNPLFNPEWPGEQPTTEIIIDRLGTKYLPCLIFCTGNGGNRADCEAPIKCHFMRVSASINRAENWRVSLWDDEKQNELAAEVRFTSLDTWEVWPFAGTTWADYFDSSQSGHPWVQYKDPLGSTCSEHVIVYCSCPCVGDFAFDDDSTPDTISAGSNISMYVTGGCPPYSWSVSGVGYSLSGSIELSETLTCAAAGTCGVDYAAYAAVTVTDNCEAEVTFDIRNTTNANWAGYYPGCILGCCFDDSSPAGGCSYDYFKTEGRYKQQQRIDGCGNSEEGCIDCCHTYDNSPDCGADTGSVCGDPLGSIADGINQCTVPSSERDLCNLSLCISDGYCWRNTLLYYELWTCS